MNGEKQREGFLDLLRFLAAFAVVLFHYAFRGDAQGHWLTFGFPELAITRYGYLGVELFFMISGYVIIWSIQGRTVLQFAIHRFIRLYPTFWLCILITIAVEFLTHSGRFYPGNLAALANFTMVPSWLGFQEIDGAYWSLAIELEFYVLVGAAVWIFGYRRLDSVLCVWAGASFLATHYGYPFLLPCGVYYPYFCLGGAFYLMHRNGGTVKLVALAMASTALCLQQAVAEASYLAGFYHTSFNPVICCLAVYASAVLVFASHRIALTARLQRIVLLLGGVTYPLYLLHSMIGYSVMDAYFTQADRWVALCATILLVLALATVVYIWFDRPVRAKLRSITSGAARSGGRVSYSRSV